MTCDDRLSARTVSNYYGGLNPVTGRDAPRLRIRVYRMKGDWRMRDEQADVLEKLGLSAPR